MWTTFVSRVDWSKLDNRVICKGIVDKTMGLVASFWELMQSHPSFFSAWIIIHKEWCHTIKNQFSSLSYLDRWPKLAFHRPIWDVGQQMSCTLFSILKFSLRYEKRRSQKFHPTMKLGSNTWQPIELFI